MVIDSGATINVCPSFFAQDYPLYQTYGGGLVSATGQSIKQHGIKSLLFEIEKDLYTWIKFKVCEVSHVFLSVPALNRGGHHVHFGSNLYIDFNGSTDQSRRVQFADAGDHY